MDIISISNEITKKIQEIDTIRKEIRQRGEDKASTLVSYEMAVAKTLMGLNNGREYTLGGDTIKDPPKSIMDKLAKGICYDEKLRSETADIMYKSLTTNLEAVLSQLNALQSLFRHLDKV